MPSSSPSPAKARVSRVRGRVAAGAAVTFVGLWAAVAGAGGDATTEPATSATTATTAQTAATDDAAQDLPAVTTSQS
ncbi:MAG TPA: hypothetical protein VF533_08615 [Solirubrobacteraceae bacterium]|jgi:hypothetical protein